MLEQPYKIYENHNNCLKYLKRSLELFKLPLLDHDRLTIGLFGKCTYELTKSSETYYLRVEKEIEDVFF